MDNFLAKIDNKNLIAINPSAKRQTNLWPLDRFAQVGKWLIRSHNIKIITLGSEKDNEKAEQLKKIIEDEAINVAGKLIS